MLPPALFILIATSIAAQPASAPDSTNPAQTPPATAAPSTPTTPPPHPEIRVTLKTGVSWDGLLIRKDDRVITLLVSGIETSIDREEVKETKVLPAIEDRYRESYRVHGYGLYAVELKTDNTAVGLCGFVKR